MENDPSQEGEKYERKKAYTDQYYGDGTKNGFFDQVLGKGLAITEIKKKVELLDEGETIVIHPFQSVEDMLYLFEGLDYELLMDFLIEPEEWEAPLDMGAIVMLDWRNSGPLSTFYDANGQLVPVNAEDMNKAFTMTGMVGAEAGLVVLTKGTSSTANSPVKEMYFSTHNHLKNPLPSPFDETAIYRATYKESKPLFKEVRYYRTDKQEEELQNFIEKAKAGSSLEKVMRIYAERRLTDKKPMIKRFYSRDLYESGYSGYEFDFYFYQSEETIIQPKSYPRETISKLFGYWNAEDEYTGSTDGVNNDLYDDSMGELYLTRELDTFLSAEVS